MGRSSGHGKEASSYPLTDDLVRFEKVHKSFNFKANVISNFCLDVARGEFLTLLGPSGSGKSTCLMMLAGFESITEGDIKVDGVSMRSVPPHARNIGMVFQNYALFPHMTVEDNIKFPLRSRRLPAAEVDAKTKAILETVRLGGFQKRYPRELSGGQQQRVALARALVFEPKLILMDEPLGALDLQLREHMQFELRNIHRTLGVTIVNVTHDQHEALAMSDRVAVLKDGELQQVDTPSALYDAPHNAFVAQFIGQNNALAGRAEWDGGPLCTVTLDNLGVIRACPVNLPRGASSVSVMIRPELIDLNAGSTADNRLPATVTEIIRLGDHYRVTARLSNGVELVVKAPYGRSFPGLTRGDAVQVSWDNADAKAFS